MIKVLKFGGTSVGSAANMKKVAEIVRREQARITVLSAMSGTTDSLVRISRAAASGDRNAIKEQLAMLTDKYTRCIEELLRERKQQALARMNATFGLIRDEAAAFEEYESERKIIAQGELLTSAIFTAYLQETGLKAECLYSPDFMVKDPGEKVDTERIGRALARVAGDDSTFFVAQGFICSDSQGRIDNLGRGGSDYSAALMGAAVEAAEVQIWTDIDGMHNNDPRFVEKTRPVHNLHFEEASELAYFGAKILHPTCVLPAKMSNIPVRLLNTLEPTAEGTLISSKTSTPHIKAVAAKDNITAIKIKSSRMLLAYGYLKSVFETFEQYKTPIDMIATSEVGVSLTIDNDKFLPEILSDLKKFGTVTVDKDMVIICVVGDMEWTNTGYEAKALDALSDIPVRMISYGGSNYNISFLIRKEDKVKALNSLSKMLFKD